MKGKKQESIQFAPIPLYTGLLVHHPVLFKMIRWIGREYPFQHPISHPFYALKQVLLLDPQDIGLSNDYRSYEVICSGVCGSDRNLITLQMGTAMFDFLPNIAPNTLNALQRFILWTQKQYCERIRRWEPGRVVAPYTIGHEIVVKDSRDRLGVLYPILSCAAKSVEEQCRQCSEGIENLCENIMSGDVRGIHGFGAITENRDQLGGGLSERVIAHRQQFIPLPDGFTNLQPNERLERAVMTDTYACAINGVNMVLTRAEFDNEVPILIIGMGALGFCVMDYLSQLGYENVTVVTRRDRQSGIVGQYSPYKTVQLGKTNYEEPQHQDDNAPFKIVFDCVGNDRSFQLAVGFVADSGHLVDLGLAVLEGYLDGYDLSLVGPQDSVSINRFGKKITFYEPFWATKAQYQEALRRLIKVHYWQSIVQLRDRRELKRAFFPTGDDKRYLKQALCFRSLTI
ncbi:hypothetical protein JW930_04485 [Candidatus Woesearchaeota archaeon]|nr:hypothetical protein [Candidatus Woesearchaeota archaeon]